MTQKLKVPKWVCRWTRASFRSGPPFFAIFDPARGQIYEKIHEKGWFLAPLGSTFASSDRATSANFVPSSVWAAVRASLLKCGSAQCVLSCVYRKTYRKGICFVIFFRFFGVWCLDLSVGCLKLSVGCLELSFGCLDLSFGCFDADLQVLWVVQWQTTSSPRSLSHQTRDSHAVPVP